MTKDSQKLKESHRKAVAVIRHFLDREMDAVYLTLGDPAIYCSFSYLQRLLEAEGYSVQLVSGVPSFTAAAARLNMSLAEGDTALHIVPGALDETLLRTQPGTYIMMKTGRHMKQNKTVLRRAERSAQAVINCGMNDEILCRNIDEIPDEAGYFSLMISKQDGEENK